MVDPQRFKTAVLETALRVLTAKAGGEIIITRDDYLNYIDDSRYHFHFEKIGQELRFRMVIAEECVDEHETEPEVGNIFGPTGRRIQ